MSRMSRLELVGLLLLTCTQILTEHRDLHERRYQHGHHHFPDLQERMTREVRVKQGRLRGMVVQSMTNYNLQLVDVFLGKFGSASIAFLAHPRRPLELEGVGGLVRICNPKFQLQFPRRLPFAVQQLVPRNNRDQISGTLASYRSYITFASLRATFLRAKANPIPPRSSTGLRRINRMRLIRTKMPSRLTQSGQFRMQQTATTAFRRSIAIPERIRLRSVSKSFLAAAYARFEAPDTSKDPKRGARVRASMYFGNRYYSRRFPPASPRTPPAAAFPRPPPPTRSSSVRQVASARAARAASRLKPSTHASADDPQWTMTNRPVRSQLSSVGWE